MARPDESIQTLKKWERSVQHNFFDKHRSFIFLSVWAVALLFFLRHTPYAIEEGAAKAMLLDWSIVDEVSSSVVTLGVPDFRAIIWLPIAFLFSGNFLSIKVATLLLMAFVGKQFYHWCLKNFDAEVALLATGLLLIAPLTIGMIDTLSVGSYLLSAFVIGLFYIEAPKQWLQAFNARWFFPQLAICAFVVSLHPAGLAYPLSLIWKLREADVASKKIRNAMFLGIGLATLLSLLLAWGWHDRVLFQNPINSLLGVLGIEPVEEALSIYGWLLGSGIAILVVVTSVYFSRRLPGDLLGRALSLSLLIGLIAADSSWAYLVLIVVLVGAFAWLTQPFSVLQNRGFLLERGWLFVLIVLIGTSLMRADRAYYVDVQNASLSAQDRLIQIFADQVQDMREQSSHDSDEAKPKIRVASQWPARTMLACRCDAFELPPVAVDEVQQLRYLKGLSHIMLSPTDSVNLALSSKLARLSTQLPTIALEPGGVILQVKGE
jgi:hypothetical protein